jgi:hypothetical protein
VVGGADESLIVLRHTVCLIGNGVHRGQGRDWARRRDAERTGRGCPGPPTEITRAIDWATMPAPPYTVAPEHGERRYLIALPGNILVDSQLRAASWVRACVSRIACAVPVVVRERTKL